MGNTLDAIEGGGLLVTVVDLVPLDAIDGGGVNGVLPVHATALFPDSDAEDIESITVVLLPHGFDIGQFGLAGRAPGRPEVYQEYFALAHEVGQVAGLVNGLTLLVQAHDMFYGEIRESLANGGAQAGFYALFQTGHKSGILLIERGGELIQIAGEFFGLEVGINLLEGLHAHGVVQVLLQSGLVVIKESVVGAVGIGFGGLLVIGQGDDAGTVGIHKVLVPLRELGHLFFYGLGLAGHQHGGNCHQYEYTFFHNCICYSIACKYKKKQSKTDRFFNNI